MVEKRACKRCGAQLTPHGSFQGICPRCLMELGMTEDSKMVITGSGDPPPPPPDPEELGPLFPQHEILEVLGQGGMGVVYKARQKGLDRLVALKLLPSSAGRDPSFAERFTREARALASLSHPGIVSVFDFGRAGEHYYFAMELVDGVNLRQMIRAGQVSPRQALQIVEQICDALQYAHEEGVVHRDIKPENILVDRKGQVKITDFGLAKLLKQPGERERLTLSNQVMGTPHYMAPEQVEHPQDVDHRADIYSLGVVFYELLTGELPLGRFEAPSHRVEVDVRLDEVVLRTLEKEPRLRYQTAGEVRTDVSSITSTPGGAAPTAAAAGTAGGSGGGRRWGLIVVLIVLGLLVLPVVLAITAALFLGGRSVESVAGVPELEPLAPQPVDVRDVLIWEFGRPGIAEDSDLRFGLAGDRAGRVDEILQAAWASYLEWEEREVDASVVGPQTARIRVEGLSQAWEQRQSDLRAELLTVAPPGVVALLAGDEVASRLLPLGRRDTTIEIQRTEQAFLVNETVDGAPATIQSTPEELPRHLARFWNRLFVTPPASAYEALKLLLAVIEDVSGEAGTIHMQSFDGESSGSTVSVEVDLAFLAEDSLEATRLFDRFRAEIVKRNPEAWIGESSSDAKPWGTYVGGLDMRLAFPQGDRPASSVHPADSESVESYVRSIGKRPAFQIGLLDIDPFSKRGRRVWDSSYRIDPTEGQGRPLETLVEFLGALEEEDEGSILTRIQLECVDRVEADQPVTHWTFRATLTIRRPPK